MILGFIVAGLIIGLDQLTKFLIYGTATRSIIGNLLWFESTLNTGVAFSMFEGESYIFIIISAIASVVLIWLIFSKKLLSSKFEKLSLGLIFGGTIGNLIDRIIFGGVRDFISLKFINFAIFNIADMGITIGAIMLCVFLLISAFKGENENKKSQNVSQETENQEQNTKTNALETNIKEQDNDRT